MGIKLSTVLGATKTISINFGGDGALDVTFRPGSVTPASLARAMSVQAGSDANAAETVALIVEFLADVLVSWNLCDENDTPIGCDRAALALLPLELLGRVFAEINGGGDELGEAPAT